MNEDELEWITNRHEGELMYFMSPKGVLDTLYIKGIWIHNDLDPINWSYFNTGRSGYIAQANIRCYAKNRQYGGILEIVKLDSNSPICFSSIFFGKWVEKVPLKTSSLKVNGILLNDVMFFNESYTEQDYVKENPLNSYAWSKKYGPVQYTLQDGTTFTRIDIGKSW